MVHLDKHSIAYLVKNNMALECGRSCETHLAGLVNDLTGVLDNRGQADLCVIDFDKALIDVVPRHRLITCRITLGSVQLLTNGL